MQRRDEAVFLMAEKGARRLALSGDQDPGVVIQRLACLGGHNLPTGTAVVRG